MNDQSKKNPKFTGEGNYGPKSAYIAKIEAMDDNSLRDEAERMIWLSAYAANNSRSDYHWQCDACYYEAIDREKGFLYDQAYKRVEATIR